MWLTALYIVPLVIVVATSVGSTDSIGRPIYGFHLDAYRQALSPLFLPILIRSVAYATIVTAVCLVVGYCASYFIVMYTGRWSKLLMVLVLVPWLVDYLIRTYAWRQILGDQGFVSDTLQSAGLVGGGGIHLLNTHLSVLLGLVYNYLPLMILPLYVALDHLDKSMIEAGRDLYGSPRAVFRHVTLPITMPGALAGSLVVFLLTLGDWPTAKLLGSPAQYMIGNIIQDQFTTQSSLPLGSAMVVLLFTIILMAVGVIRMVGRFRSGRAS